jgi:hypothetical protein
MRRIVSREERRMIISIILRAVADYVTPEDCRRKSHNHNQPTGTDAEEAKEWFLSSDTSVGSFRWFCERGDLCYRTIRKRLWEIPHEEIYRMLQCRGEKNPTPLAHLYPPKK